MWNIIQSVLNSLIVIYVVTTCGSYLVLAIIAIFEMREHMNKNYYVDFNYILSSPFAPGISLIAPAYNEGLSIIDNVRSLLSLIYNKYEVIVVNDGSKDDTMRKLIEAFELVVVAYDVQKKIQTKPIKAIYKSQNKAFQKLTVVDKYNGGKADALNAGLNLSASELVACIDVDCIIEPEALLKMAKPFLEDQSVIAAGGAVRIANSCVIEEGRLIEVKLPSTFLPRMQVLEYLRAFLLNRLAWSKLNGLLLISGAFGLFKREVAMLAGGYNCETVGEDLDLVVRMRMVMHEAKLPYRVAFIPDPLCWTEAPADSRTLGRQRNRWARGTFETLYAHRKLFFNPRYGLMGMVSFPVFLFFEWLSPFIELTGLLWLCITLVLGKANLVYVLLLFLSTYCFAFFISMLALFAEEVSFFRYTKTRNIVSMITVALIEPILHHPMVVWWSLKGNLDLIKGKKSWGEMTRKGFVQNKNMERALQTLQSTN